MDSSQYLAARNGGNESGLVLTNIDNNTQQIVSEALSLTGIAVAQVDLEACHRVKKKTELLSCFQIEN